MAVLLIGGDTCPVGRNEALFREGNASLLLNDLLPNFQEADWSILNLEAPLIERDSQVLKHGPTLGAPADCIRGFAAMGIDVLALANNHIMDHGPQGLRSTIRILEGNGIIHVGAGENIDAARRILIHEIRGVRIGILAAAEREFGIASRCSPGFNPLDCIDIYRNIAQNHSCYDRLIVLLHAGTECYPYPRPELMDLCRYLVELGASAVLCQHSHCAGCMETYQGAPILYGQGNFLFDYASDEPAWHDGLLVQLEITKSCDIGVRLIPFQQSDRKRGVRRMPAAEGEVFMNAFDERSRAIADPDFVTAQWLAYCEKYKRHYLNGLHGKPGFVRRLAGKFDLLHYLDSKNVLRMRLNYIRCESLREALITVLSRETDPKKPQTVSQFKG